MDFYQGEYEDLMEFSTAVAENPFGSELLRLAEANYDSVEDAIEDISTGLQKAGFEADEDIVLGLMTGEMLPTEDLLITLSELCNSDTEYNRLINSAEASYDIAEALLDAIEDGEIEIDENDLIVDEDEDEDDEDYETVPRYEYDEDEDELDEEQFSRYAEAVEALTEKEYVTEALKSLSSQAEDLVEGGYMPPIAFSLLFGDEEDVSYAEFSRACDKEDTDPDNRLDNIAFTLSVFKAMGPAFEFTSATEEDEFEFSQDEIDDLADQIEASYELYKEGRIQE